MLKLAPAVLAVTLAFSTFAAYAATPAATQATTAAAPDTSATSTAAAANLAAELPATTLDVVQNPSFCGGIPAPHLTPKDGYHTACVNGALRFVSDSDLYQYKVTVSRTVKGKKAAVSAVQLSGPLGQPVSYSSGTVVPYVKSSSVDKETGKSSIETGQVFNGFMVTLDPARRTASGEVVVGFSFNDTQLVSMRTLDAGNSPAIQEPQLRTESEQSVIMMTPGKPLTLSGADTSVELTVTHIEK
jgi:hypothetical protein